MDQKQPTYLHYDWAWFPVHVNWYLSPHSTFCLVLVCGALLVPTVDSAHAQSIEPEDAPSDATTAATGALQPRTITVLPFSNISGAADDEWIGTGIADTVTVALDLFDELSVVDREAFLDVVSPSEVTLTSTNDALARDVALGLGVDWLVTGGFQRLGDQMRVTAQIVNAETGTYSEAVKVDGQLDQLFDLQDRLVDELSDGFAAIAGTTASAPAIVARDTLPTDSGEFEGEFGEGPGANGEGFTQPTTPRGRAPGPQGEPGAGRGTDNTTAFAASSPSSPTSLSTTGAGVTRDVGDVATAVTGRLSIDAGGGVMSGAAMAGNAGTLAGRVTVRPVRTQTPPDVDGRLDDAVWRNAARITDFVQRQPTDGAPATEATDVYVAYDSSNIYLAFHAHYADPSMMRANRADRDQAERGDDLFTVYFDTFLDQQRAYSFSVNGYGVQGDSIVTGGRGGGGGFGGPGGGGGGPGRGRVGVPRGDASWDALFSTGGQIVEDGFTAEMAIPLKSLRYPAKGGDVPHTWGFQVARLIRAKDETVVWSPFSRDVAGFLPQIGVMDGMTRLSTSRNVEIQPTFTAFRFGTLDEETGRVVDADPRPEAGANFKYGVTSNLTADFTLNPDFSQIESDRPQVEVNQRFALFFPELRPFFLEGAEIFQVQAPLSVVHTRTIVDPLYGAKLTGKAGKTSIGVLYANDEAPGAVDDLTDLAFEKSAQTFIGRVRYDLYAESFVGAVFTDREFLDGSSRLAGLDSNFRLGNTSSVGFRALRTDHRDQDGLVTGGYLVDANFRQRGRKLSYGASAFALSPDFKTDVGFVRRTDQRRFNGNVDYEWRPEHWIVSWGPDARYGRNYNFDQVLQDENLNTGVNVNFARNIRVITSADRDKERYEGINFDKRRYRVGGSVNTSQIISFGGGFNWGDQIYFDEANPFLGRETGLRAFINFRPISRFSSNININTSRFTDPNGFFVPGLNDGAVDENGTVFNVNIFRALSTYQFSDRSLFRNITEFDTFDQTVGFNFLLTYRVNSGTAFFVGYDDHYQQREQFDDQVNITGTGYQQTNRAIFTKFQYLFRY